MCKNAKLLQKNAILLDIMENGKIGNWKKNVKKSNLMLYISRKTIFKRFSFMTCINMSL